MLVFSRQSLVFVAVPKTGSSAIEGALKPKADFAFSKQHKHMMAETYHRKIAPFLANDFGLKPEVFAVMREPEEQIRSWYRYRTRKNNVVKGNDTLGRSFNEFVLAVISDDPPPYGKIGSQFRMLTSKSGDVLVNHLFAFENDFPLLRSFLEQRFGQKITFRQKNVSPEVEAPLDPAIHKKLVAARVKEFDLFARLRDAKGHLQTDVNPPEV